MRRNIKGWVLFFSLLLLLGGFGVVFILFHGLPFDPGPTRSRARAFFLSYQTSSELLVPKEQLKAPCALRELHASMEFYATHACGNCHRLRGFEGNVLFAGSEEKHDEMAAWFVSLFPNLLTGKQCLAAVDSLLPTLEQRLVESDVKETILQLLDQKHPGLLISFYPAFGWAQQQKKAFFTKNKSSQEEVALWERAFHKTLYMYIQLHGLGRLIAPPLHWSGIYRSQEWLMGHFRDPAAYTPGTYMPPFPFSDEEFWGQTRMLVTLGIKNRDSFQALWEKSGFDPEVAYQICCADCHGKDLRGDGVVAKRLYPIVKDLRNPVFLLGCGPTMIAQFVEGGKMGTPMPGWSESYVPDRRPVLSINQVKQIVSWIFSSLPDQRNLQIPPYSINDVVAELRQEKSPMQGIDLFEQKATGSGVNYFLKSSLYTIDNLREGSELFDTRCASCHADSGEGNGRRASAMKDAKPRMLTNVLWLNSCDDLCLLRSIKYGVPGTAMSAWGDQTSACQRLQLLMYIRSLTWGDQITFEFDYEVVKNFISSQEALDRLRCTAEDRFSSESPVYKEVEQLIQAVNQEKKLYSDLAGEIFQSKQKACAQKFLELYRTHGALFSWREGVGLIYSLREEEISEASEECIDATQDPLLREKITQCEKETKLLRERQRELYTSIQKALNENPVENQGQMRPMHIISKQ